MASGNSSTIKQWPPEERPRERLLHHGVQSLSDAQLLTILLRTGHPNQNAHVLALDVIRRFGSLAALSQASIGELCGITGVGQAKAAFIQAAFEIGNRVLSAPLYDGVQIQCSREIFRHYHASLRALKREIFKVVLLNGKNRILRDVTISEGSLTMSLVHPREAFNPAVKDSAAAVVFIHNHPSGDPAPSAEDRDLTKRLVECGALLGIRVLDHLVIGDGNYYSFADQGFIQGSGFTQE